ncbi:hypothetical protein FK529_10820 [Tsukamurella asaccharolytica]|uniref:Uncharacterized protein n=1 Tax=Tsukamurella asaccharolytica TaxID=2592067 RepID=A0A5C5RAX0_9ACTN|nr:hypothetical protein [Tsukamurella asaccharolytica]TWS19654.1 hypothetical protein FK529_10820 [Tsukamurella asaccharolytica]
MTLHVDCSTCPGKPRACGDCSVGFLLGPPVTAVPGLNDAIAAFANEGMLPRLRVVPDQAKRAG